MVKAFHIFNLSYLGSQEKSPSIGGVRALRSSGNFLAGLGLYIFAPLYFSFQWNTATEREY